MNIIETNKLSKQYGKSQAVKDVDLIVEEGGVFALIGENGAGKSSLLKMLLGLESISAGSATVHGLDAAKKHVKIRQLTGYVPETHHMYDWMKVGEIIKFVSAGYPTWDSAYCDQLLEKFQLDPTKKIKSLSRGMVAKVALTLALAHKPNLLVLDEPTSGLDAVVRKDFLESIIDVAADEGRTVIISSHLLTDVERVTDRVGLLKRGKLQFVEDAEDLKDRTRELVVTLKEPTDETPTIPGLLNIQHVAREVRMVTDQFTDTVANDLERQFPGSVVEVRRLGLEEIFLAHAAKG